MQGEYDSPKAMTVIQDSANGQSNSIVTANSKQAERHDSTFNIKLTETETQKPIEKTETSSLTLGVDAILAINQGTNKSGWGTKEPEPIETKKKRKRTRKTDSASSVDLTDEEDMKLNGKQQQSDNPELASVYDEYDDRDLVERAEIEEMILQAISPFN